MKARNFVALMGSGSTLLIILAMLLNSCGEKPGPAIHDGEAIRRANGTIGSIADAKAPSNWNGGYGIISYENEYRSEVAISNAFARELGRANLKNDTLQDKIRMLEYKLEQCQGKRANNTSERMPDESMKGAVDIGSK